MLVRRKHEIALRYRDVPSEALILLFILLKLHLCNFLVLLPLDELVPELLEDDSFMGLNFANRFTGRWLPVELALDRVENFSETSSRSLLLNFASLVEYN